MKNGLPLLSPFSRNAQQTRDNTALRCSGLKLANTIAVTFFLRKVKKRNVFLLLSTMNHWGWIQRVATSDLSLIFIRSWCWWASSAVLGVDFNATIQYMAILQISCLVMPIMVYHLFVTVKSGTLQSQQKPLAYRPSTWSRLKFSDKFTAIWEMVSSFRFLVLEIMVLVFQNQGCKKCFCSWERPHSSNIKLYI